MAMIGAIVLARRDVSIPKDYIKDLKNQKSLSEKKIPLLSENSLK
jgi:NAD(P)H-quinone oxidoreductase subunit 6